MLYHILVCRNEREDKIASTVKGTNVYLSHIYKNKHENLLNHVNYVCKK